jgi:predicted DNA-binding transcriptional regulator YafY
MRPTPVPPQLSQPPNTLTRSVTRSTYHHPMNRIRRIFQIHESLSRRDEPRSPEEWARTLNVSVRTIYRDMACLEKQLGAPVVLHALLGVFRYEQGGRPLGPGLEKSKLTRLLTLIRLIKSEPGKTTTELAEAMGGSQRTTFRDIRALGFGASRSGSQHRSRLSAYG